VSVGTAPDSFCRLFDVNFAGVTRLKVLDIKKWERFSLFSPCFHFTYISTFEFTSPLFPETINMIDGTHTAPTNLVRDVLTLLLINPW